MEMEDLAIFFFLRFFSCLVCERAGLKRTAKAGEGETGSKNSHDGMITAGLKEKEKEERGREKRGIN